MAKKFDATQFQPEPKIERWFKGEPRPLLFIAHMCCAMAKSLGVWEDFVAAMEPTELGFEQIVHGKPLIDYLGHNRRTLALTFGLTPEQVDDVDRAVRRRGQSIPDGPALATRIIDSELTIDQQLRFKNGLTISAFDGVSDNEALAMLDGNPLLLEVLHEMREFCAGDPRRIAQLQAAEASENVWEGGSREPEPEPPTAA